MWQSQSDIHWIQVESTSLCQAGCIDCNRWRPVGDQWHLNGDHHMMNQYMSLEDWRSCIQQFHDLRCVNLCGNVGDPMAHPQAYEISKAVLDHLPTCRVEINTNAAIGTVEQWTQMGSLPNVEMVCGIDGLEDTLPIYRRGVTWQRVMERTQAFICAGGDCVWKWVDFPHTRHQIDDARAMSRELGFSRFEIKPRFTQDREFDAEIVRMAREPIMKSHWYRSGSQDSTGMIDKHDQMCQDMLDEGKRVIPRCQESPDVDYHHPMPHINVDMTFWPCCFTACGPFHISAHHREWWQRLQHRYGADWNNLVTRGVDEVIQHEFFQSFLPSSWKSTKGKDHVLTCLQVCGECVK